MSPSHEEMLEALRSSLEEREQLREENRRLAAKDRRATNALHRPKHVVAGTEGSVSGVTDAGKPGPGGSAYEDGWYGYVLNDLQGKFANRYCGGGDTVACSQSLWSALDAAGNALAAAQGPDPSAWRSDAGAERIQFAPGFLKQTMRWTNRPTYQQVLSFGG